MTDEEIIEAAEGFREGILEDNPFGENGSSHRMCGAIAWPLAGYLRAICEIDCAEAKSLVSTPEGDWEHIWIRLSDGRVLDPTADQFNHLGREYPAVYLGPPTELHERPADD